MQRFIQIDGVYNFRDFGGYKTKNGAKIKKRTLFRSGQFHKLSEKGREKLKELAPKYVFDLRRINERHKQPSAFEDLAIKKVENPSMNIEKEALPPHLQFLQIDNQSPQNVANYMVKICAELPFDNAHIAVFKQCFDILANNETPIIIHCAAGKDRTGFLCALILKMLGANDDDIMDDYLLTNQIPNMEQIIRDYSHHASQLIGREISYETMRPMGLVDEKYLMAGFEEINRRFGNLENYLSEIGVNETQIDEIRNLLLE